MRSHRLSRVSSRSVRGAAAGATLAALVYACGGAAPPTPTLAPTPTQTTVALATASIAPTPSPTASPRPTASPSPAPVPTPKPTPVTSDVALVRFLVRFQDGIPPLHVQTTSGISATSGSRSAQSSENVEGDVDANDFAGSVTLQQTGVTVSSDMVLADGACYVRLVGGEWKVCAVPVNRIDLEPFSSLAFDSLEPGLTMGEGEDALHDLSSSAVGIDLSALTQVGLRKPKLESPAFHLQVDDLGIPVRATLVMAVTGRLNGAAVRYDYSIGYWFSNFGSPVTIDAPI